MDPSRAPTRLNAVDALRALAVLPVILFHLNPAWLPGGYLGVDVFFVISGYLITGILMREMTDGTFGFGAFYARRIRRILPAMLVMVVSVTIYWAWSQPWSFAEVAKIARATLSLRANLAIEELVGNYWGGDAQVQPLLHTWSLAVEEQFYLLFPLAFWGLWRACPSRAWLALLGTLALASLGWHLHASGAAPVAAFYDTSARAWELLAGALLAVATRDASGRGTGSGGWVGWTGLAIVLLAYLSPTAGVPSAWRPGLAVVGAVAFLWAAPRREGVHAWLDQPALVYVGLISYSLYLWHWPVAVLARNSVLQEWPPVLAGGLEVLAILGLGVASYHFVEKPSRHGRRVVWLALGVSIAAYFGIREVARSREKAALRLSQDFVLAPGRVAGADEAYETLGGFRRLSVTGRRFAEVVAVPEESLQKYRNVDFPALPARAPGTLASGGAEGSARRVLVWGDSHAMVLGPTIDKLGKELGLGLRFRIKEGADPVVLLPPDGDGLAQAGYQALRSGPDCCLFVFRYDARRFADYEASFAEILKHTRLIVVQQPPVLEMPDVCTVDYFAYQRDRQGLDLRRYSPGEQKRSLAGRREFERQLLARFGSDPRFRFILVDPVLRTEDGRPRWWDGRDTLFYLDDDHLSEFGARLMEPLLRRALEQACGLERSR